MQNPTAAVTNETDPKAMIRGVRSGVKMGQTLRATGCLAGEMTAGPDKQT
jgi:hypothetical protein